MGKKKMSVSPDSFSNIFTKLNNVELSSEEKKLSISKITQIVDEVSKTDDFQ